MSAKDRANVEFVGGVFTNGGDEVVTLRWANYREYLTLGECLDYQDATYSAGYEDALGDMERQIKEWRG